MDVLVNIFEHVRKIIIQVAITKGIQDDKILDKITAEPPKDDKHGDISSNIALLGSKILNMNIIINNTKILQGSTPRRCPDISKIKSLGYKANNNFYKGLEKTINWYSNNFNNV